MSKEALIARFVDERKPRNGAISMDELLIPGVNGLTDEQYRAEYARTPPINRMCLVELQEAGVEHLLRMRMEFFEREPLWRSDI